MHSVRHSALSATRLLQLQVAGHVVLAVFAQRLWYGSAMPAGRLGARLVSMRLASFVTVKLAILVAVFTELR